MTTSDSSPEATHGPAHEPAHRSTDDVAYCESRKEPLLDPRAQRLRDALAGWPRRRVRLVELWRILDDIDPATRLAPNRRDLLLDAVQQLAKTGALELPAASSWDRIEKPHLPRFITLPAQEVQPVTRRDIVWHPALAWVPDSAVSATHRTNLAQINTWLHRDRTDLVVPLRERSLEIFGHEKTLDRLIRTSLFAPERLNLTALRTRRAAPRFTYEIVGDGTTLLVVENSDTFDSLALTLPRHSDPIGVLGWGSGGGFEASVLSVPRLSHTITRILYFGDLDLRGLQIPASASRTAHADGLPKVEPATTLYEALLDLGRPQVGGRVSERTAREAVTWLPEHLRARAEALLTSGRRVAQEHLGLRYFTENPQWTDHL